MSNFGFNTMRVVNPYEIAFREARSAVKSAYILEQAQVFSTVADAVADCSLVVGSTSVGHRDLHVPLYRLEGAGQLVSEHLASGDAAILFGSEKFGLSNEDLSFCHWAFRIPTREEHGSMNLGQSVAITLYELRRNAAGVAQRYAESPRVSGETLQRIVQVLSAVLRDSGYIQERTAESSHLKLRRLVMRLGIAESDAETWLGILRQIQWKLEQAGKEAQKERSGGGFEPA
jgi:tRNA/rRNA methyltransferase